MFTAANQMLHEFYHKNKKNEKKICTYASLIQLGPGLHSLVWGRDSDETRTSNGIIFLKGSFSGSKTSTYSPNRSIKETGESA